MKKIYTMYFLSVLMLIVQTNTLFTMRNSAVKIAKIGLYSLCSGFELMCAFNPLLATYFIHHPAIMAEKKEEYCSNAPKSIINFIKNIQNKRNIQQDIHIIVGENGHKSYSMSSHKNILYIPHKVSNDLEELLERKQFTPEEQVKINGHIASIHHELTHWENDDSTNTHIY
ncbi:MAG TPA: hypothetical protein VLB80_04840, partial [Candidatus Babeliales bacterium]|nr:hypothetical protein [Candidatus Babeliales bacterium]